MVAHLPDPIVEVEWLESNLEHVVLCDVRWYLDGRDGRSAYEEGHLPGAVFVDLEKVLAAPPSDLDGRHPLPSSRKFARELAKLGIGDDTVVVAYDDQHGTVASRLVWMLRAIGRKATLLDGGIDAWNGELEKGPVEREPAEFTATPFPPIRLALANDVADAVDADGAVVLDARAPERYRGDIEPIDPRAGHVPGALNAHFEENFRDGRFKTREELRKHYGTFGVEDDTNVIVYCGSGVTACVDLLALEHAGFEKLRLYPGSWSQWANDPNRLAATGEEHADEPATS
ncbi:MAG: sulfurtransferase [Actinomycetota bacterium]|nr:sulfurtransferase [Actinomycetota bacterium]